VAFKEGISGAIAREMMPFIMARVDGANPNSGKAREEVVWEGMADIAELLGGEFSACVVEVMAQVGSACLGAYGEPAHVDGRGADWWKSGGDGDGHGKRDRDGVAGGGDRGGDGGGVAIGAGAAAADGGDVKGKGRRRRRGARRGKMPAAMDGEDEAVLAGVGE
jgi:hypothetical protein